MSDQENLLYYGDNLEIMRRYVPDESVDLVYADPPFKSNANYNVLFQEKDGTKAASQIQAFEDTWTWDNDDEKVYSELVTAGGKIADCLQAFRKFIGPCDMLAYLVMMTPRLIECKRVLKGTGSMFLHCDTAASHYLKLLMDAVFSPENFKNEIIWKRYGAHNDAGQGSRHFGRIHDVILFYSMGKNTYWSQVFVPLDHDYIASTYNHEDADGRKYTTTPLTGPGGAEKGNPVFEWKGHTRAWRYSKETMERLDKEGRLSYSRTGYVRQKLYLDESKGKPVQDIWEDIASLSGGHTERLGYPTQKPVALLERIIKASCPEGGTVLDPFCGCGTTIAAAQTLKRKWIGIDITHLAIMLMKERLKDAFGSEGKCKVVGEPVSVPDAERLASSDPFQFQWWALGLVGARPVEEKKGADKGIDGKIVFQGDTPDKFESVIISIKAGHTGVSHVRDLKGVLEREKASIGVLISMQEPTKPMELEATTAGLFVSELWGKKYPKIQLLTIADLLGGKGIQMPSIKQVSKTFKKAVRQKQRTEQGTLL